MGAPAALTVSRRIVVRSAEAARIDLCLFARIGDREEARRVPLDRHGDEWTWHEPLAHGQLYALRTDLAPGRLLLDPRALAIGRLPSPLDPLGAVIDTTFDWGDDRRPATPWRDSLIYELHVRGFTMRHPDVDPALRGTFLGAASAPAIDHLRALGVTAVELMPVFAHADEPALQSRGLVNYWGYNPLSVFAPDPRFAVGTEPAAPVREFKMMVRALHAAGIEVILDVVYNHTAEGPEAGPIYSWRGLGPRTSYRTVAGSPDRYADRTGCGNTLNLDDPIVRGLVMDSLRYWADDMRVDGFRFDLASAIDRSPGDRTSLFAAIAADPILGARKLIVEPWDADGDGYRLGAFPAPVVEWNDRYRDAVRRFWRGDAGAAAEFATRLCGSGDLFAARSPLAGVNFVTAHDGFTLADLTSFAARHNDANDEDNRDGSSENYSSNGGVEGATADANVLAVRENRRRSLMATLFLSQGVPMVSGGDEMSRSQRGNNNAYCQDNALSWTHWDPDDPFLAFVRDMAALRRDHPALRHDRFLTADDVRWLRTDGGDMTERDWRDPGLRAFALVWRRDDLAICFNAGPDALPFELPGGAVTVGGSSIFVSVAAATPGPRDPPGAAPRRARSSV